MAGLLRRPWVMIILALGTAVAVVALYLFQPWRLFTDRTVNEATPLVEGTPLPSGTGRAAPAAARKLSSGSFIGHEHGTTGTASVIRLGSGKRVLRIENLDTSDGPDLRVWLSDQPVKPGTSGWFVFDDGAYVELGELKGNKGDQNYDIPAGADLGKLTSVTIWCKRFRVSFGAAALTA